MNETKIFLNDWAAYNDGSIGYGWFTPAEAIDFMESKEDQDLEWFIADIDNYLGVDFGNLDYANVEEVCETIKTLEDLQDWERDEVIAVMEYDNCSVEEAIDNRSNYCMFSSEESYRSYLDEEVEIAMNDCSSWIKNYFDYEAYYRENEQFAFFASNGCVILK